MSSLPSLNLPSLPGAEVPAGIRASLSAQAGQRGVAYSDVRGLQHIEGDESGIRAAAQQFESLFIGMMLKGMRDANAVFAEGNPLSSQEMTMHQEMLDQQWAIHMAESGGMGLAPVIEAQLRGERVPMPDASGVGSGSLAGQAGRWPLCGPGCRRRRERCPGFPPRRPESAWLRVPGGVRQRCAAAAGAGAGGLRGRALARAGAERS